MSRASLRYCSVCFVSGVLSRLHGFRSSLVGESMLSHNSGLQKKEANGGSLFTTERNELILNLFQPNRHSRGETRVKQSC